MSLFLIIYTTFWSILFCVFTIKGVDKFDPNKLAVILTLLFINILAYGPLWFYFIKVVLLNGLYE